MYSIFQGIGFRIPIVSEILDSYRSIPDSKAHDSGFPKQQIPRFRIPLAKISRIPESGFPYIMDIIYFLWAHDRPDIDPFHS